MKNTCIIIDDETQAINALEHELEENCPEIIVIGNAKSVEDGINKINTLNPDVIFLDIRLIDGLGFDILKKIDLNKSKVVFTTAYSEYAIQAFKFNAIDYLLKPVDSQELKNAVAKIIKTSNTDLKVLLNNMINNQTGLSSNNKIAIPCSQGIHLFHVNTIIKCESDRNYTNIFFKDGTKLLSSKSLGEYEKILGAYNFFRIHRSFLINFEHIKSYINKGNGYVLMIDKSTIPIAQRKKTEFLNLLSRVNSST